MHSRAGGKGDAASEAEDRIEHRPHRVGEWVPVDDRDRRANRTSSSEEPGTICFVLDDPAWLLLDRGDVCSPDGRFVTRSRPARGQERTDLGNELGLHEQVLERRVSHIGGLPGECDLGVRRQFDVTLVRAEVGQRHAADLGVVLRRHHDRQAGRDRTVAPGELGAILRVGDLVAIRLGAARLVTGGPHCAGVHVAQEEIVAPLVTGDVLSPTRHHHVTPTAVPGSSCRDHHGIPTVRQHVRPRDGIVRRREVAQDRRHEIAHVGRAPHLLGTWPGHEHAARHSLLQQQFGGLDDRVGVKALDHHAVVEDVADGHQRHPLMMSHVAVDDCHGRPFRQPPLGVVESLTKAVTPPGTGGTEPGEVPDRRLRLDHRREGGCIGGHDQVLAEPAFQAETGHPEARVLIGLARSRALNPDSEIPQGTPSSVA